MRTGSLSAVLCRQSFGPDIQLASTHGGRAARAGTLTREIHVRAGAPVSNLRCALTPQAVISG